MTPLAQAQHFAGDPHWTWYILGYFFFAGLAGGCYFIAVFLRHWGTPADEPVARLGFYAALPPILIAPILLTLDLNKPLRFWHMLFDTTPDDFGLNFNTGTPMSVGVWGLIVATVFVLVSFLDTLVRDGKLRISIARRLSTVLEGGAGKVWDVVGAAVLLFIAGYTGVLLAVSNQPIWSDTWALGGLFLASGLAGSAALLLILTHYRRGAEASRGYLRLSERLFAGLEILLLALLVVTLIGDRTLDEAFDLPWIPLWVLAFTGMLLGLLGIAAERRGTAPVDGDAQAVARTHAWVVVPVIVLAGVLALRAAVIFSAQV
jgi:formate-dependent nitrite reductase membrane component NrfD